MSDVSNVPGNDVVPGGALPYQMPPMENPVISAYAVELLKKMGFWSRIFAVMLFIFAGFMIACGPFMLVFGVMGTMVAAPPGGVRTTGEPPMLLIGLMYIAMGALYLIPAVYLNKFAGRAKRFATMKDMLDLEAALSAHKSFWKFMSILVLVVIGLYLLMIPVAIAIAAMKHR